MKLKVFVLFFVLSFLGLSGEELTVRIFSEVRTESVDASRPGGRRVDYAYEPEGDYIPKDEMEVLLLNGLSQMNTFHAGQEIHPAIGRPYYMAIFRGNKLEGNVIKFYEGEGSGFYLLQGYEVDEAGSLAMGSIDKKLSPLASKPLNKFFQRILSNAKRR